jgi:hypothetical protein
MYAISSQSSSRLLIDVSVEENFVCDPGAQALCLALEQVVRESKGRAAVRSLNLALNGVSDDACLAISKLIRCQIGGEGWTPLQLRMGFNRISAAGAAVLVQAYRVGIAGSGSKKVTDKEKDRRQQGKAKCFLG